MERLRLRAQSIAATDPKDAEKQLRAYFGRVTVESLEDKRFDVKIDSFSVGHITTARLSTESGAAFQFDRPRSGYTVINLLYGAVHLKTSPHCSFFPAPRCLILEHTSIRTWQFQPGTYEIVFAGSSAIKRRLSRSLEAPIPRPIAFEANLSASSPGPRLVSATVHFITTGFSREASIAPGTAASLHDMMLNIFLEWFPHNYSNDLARKPLGVLPRHIRSAIEFIHAHAKESISVEQIARAAGTSVRTLQVGFSTFRGTTPIAYLRQVRMEGARSDLLQSNPECVAQIAARWRFANPGLFSKFYREMFGELPSVTRRLGRQR